MIPFVRNFEFEYEKAKRLSPLITRVIANNPGPFTYTGTGVYIIGTNEVALIDPGPIIPEHVQALDKALEGKKLTHIFVTHHHIDHSPLAKPLAAKHGCKVYGRSPARAKPSTNVQMEEGEDTAFAPDVEICGEQIFKGKDWTLQAIHTPGHTSNHMCFALKEENTLFCGDHIMGWSTSVIAPPDGHMGDYLHSLKDIQERNFDVLRPTHGTKITDVSTFIKAYIDHRYAREAQIRSAIARGIPSIPNMVIDIYIGLDKRLYPAAALSVLSQLIHMHERGQINCDGPLGLQGHYTLADERI